MLPDIIVDGGTKVQKCLMVEAAAFYLKLLMQSRRKKSAALMINIRLRKKLLKKHGVKADCFMLEDDDADGFKEFEIRLDAGMNTQGLLRSLAHEMVHVYHYTTGDLRETSNAFQSNWKGKNWNLKKTHYYDLPWEIDAYGREQGLLTRFVEEHRYQQKRWYQDHDFT